MTPEAIAAICHLYETKQVSMPALARRYGVTLQAIWGLLHRRGIVGHDPHKLTLLQELAVCDRYQAGQSSRTLAQAFGISSKHVRWLLHKHGYALRPAGPARVDRSARPSKRARKAPLTATQVDELCHRYEAGEEVGTLAKAFMRATSNVYYWIQTRGLPRRPRRTHRLMEAQKAEICTRYAAGEKASHLAVEYGVSTTAIFGFVDRRGVVRRHDLGSHRRYTCDHRFFTQIDTEAKAYWLGFLAADGTITTTEIRLQLAARDSEHLQTFRAALQSSHPIRPVDNHGYPAMIIIIHSKQLVQDLARYHVIPRKTHTLRWPDLPVRYLGHYLRGYIDADGGFYVRHGPRQAIIRWFSLLGNRAFIREAQTFLVQHCDVLPTTLYSQPLKQHANIVTLRYQGGVQVRRIFDFLYRNAMIWLPRKRDRFEQPPPPFQPQPRKPAQRSLPFQFFPQHRRRPTPPR